MKKKGFLLKLVSYMLGLVVLTTVFSSVVPGTTQVVMAAADEDQYIANQWTVLDPGTIVDNIRAADFSAVSESGVKNITEGVQLDVEGKTEFTVNAPSDSTYNLVLEYKTITDKVLKNSVTLSWDGGEILASVPALWKDSSKTYQKDRYGNEIIPDQKMMGNMHLEFVEGFASFDKSPLSFKLKKGQHKFVLKNNTQSLVLKSIYLVQEKKPQGYQEYFKQYSEKSAGSETITIEAEDYKAKSDTSIGSSNVQKPGLYPYNTSSRLLNVINGWSWRETGKKVIWDFEVKAAGLYSLGFRYSQDAYEGMSVFRNIEIDGQLPFKELAQYPFKFTGSGFKNSIVSDSNNQSLKIWLDKGKHTIAMVSDGGPVQPIYDDLQDVMLKINDTGMELKKMTGGNTDVNRTWDVSQYMPDIVKKLNDWADRIDKDYEQLKNISGQSPTYAANLKIASQSLRELSKEPNKIPSRLAKLSEGTGSSAELIGTFIPDLSNQPLSLDRLYFMADDKEIPAADAGFFKNLSEGVKSFFISFLPKSNNALITTKSENEISIWVNRPIQYVELLQQMADSSFTPNSGIRVNFSVMPNEQKLILANAAKRNPDAALGIATSMPYQLALRGAAADLTKFKDFLPYISKDYNLETLIPYDVEGKIYGVTETQDFNVLMYRKDILNKLKIPVPQTWEDIKSLMPELQRSSMNIYIPMAVATGIKPFSSTAPFLFQNGGSIYKPDGGSTGINSDKSIKGFELMTELFNIYSVSKSAPSFYNNFRYGTMPIGVSNFTTYVTLINAAPEIAGLWDIAPAPGIKDSQGNIVRSQTASEKADVIFENSDKKEQAWKLLKWWLSKDVQVKFAYSLQARFGPEYMWNTANMSAFNELPLPEKDKKVILEQWKSIKEIPPHPAGYMIEREISNAWTDIVMNGINLRIAVDKATITSNREINRKLEEFGYIKNGKIIKEYHIPSVEDLRKQVEANK